MTDFQNYTIVPISDKTGIIKANHDKKELLVSEDIKLTTTDEGKLCATFPNFRQNSIFGFKKQSERDCSLVISDPSYFEHCIQKNGTYQLAGSSITFNGTDNDDNVVLDGNVTGSKINLGDGNDTLTIKSQDFFGKNIIDTGNGNDTIDISGNFKKFCKNQFYLGKGSDKFSASINPDDDAKTKSELESKLPQYATTVFKNKIYAIDGYTENGDKKGWFENNTFESKTHNANLLLGLHYESYRVSSADGFQEYKFKPEPKAPIVATPKTETEKPKTENPTTVAATTKSAKTQGESTKENYEARVNAGNMLYMMYGDPKGVEDAWKAMDEYVESMANPKQ